MRIADVAIPLPVLEGDRPGDGADELDVSRLIDARSLEVEVVVHRVVTDFDLVGAGGDVRDSRAGFVRQRDGEPVVLSDVRDQLGLAERRRRRGEHGAGGKCKQQ